MATNRAVKRALSVCEWGPPEELLKRGKNWVTRKESLTNIHIQQEEGVGVEEQTSDLIGRR